MKMEPSDPLTNRLAQKSINLTVTYGDYCNLGKCLQLVLRIFRPEVTEKEQQASDDRPVTRIFELH